MWYILSSCQWYNLVYFHALFDDNNLSSCFNKSLIGWFGKELYSRKGGTKETRLLEKEENTKIVMTLYRGIEIF